MHCGPELLGVTFVDWREEHGVFIDYIGRFRQSYRLQVPNAWLSRSLDEDCEITWAWMFECNEERDLDSSGSTMPAEVPAEARVSTCELATLGGSLQLQRNL